MILNKPTKETAMQYLRDVARSLPAPFNTICLRPLDDGKFDTWPGASSHHHNYAGGLAEHVAEVAYYCALLMGDEPHIDRTVVLTAAIWHDYLKVNEYTDPAEGKVEKLPYMFLVGHPVGSAMAFMEEMTGWEDENNLAEPIVHCILAHHGRREWGAPVEPKTPEAWILHAADMLSAQPLPKVGE